MFSWLKRLTTSSPPHGKTGPKREIKFMTYNVWSREDIAVYKRMQAICSLVEKHDPDVIFFQEVTPHIRSIFESSAWWKEYHSSLTVFPDEQEATKHQDFCLLQASTGELCVPEVRRLADGPRVDICPDPEMTMKPIHVATTQLERPVPPASMRFKERHAQARHAMAELSSARNVVLGGDMSWGDNADGPFPLAAGWIDAWTQLRRRPWDSKWTYDGFWDEQAGVINGHDAPRSSMRKRSDMFVCKLRDYRLSSIEMIGDSNIGLEYARRFTMEYRSVIDLKPSCHRGLVLTIVPK
ncbi:hypothetical protein ACP70R_005752 [Stipagrostis hirtigluma subsp. patula]